MRVEGETLSDYCRFSKWHIIVLVAWTLLNFIFMYKNPALSTSMTKVAPVFLVAVFAHLGYKMGLKRKYNLNSAIFNGLKVGCLTGFLAGLLGTGGGAYEFVMFAKVGGWTLGPGTSGLVIGAVSFGIIIGTLRAILGAIITAIAWISTRKY